VSTKVNAERMTNDTIKGADMRSTEGYCGTGWEFVIFQGRACGETGLYP
jgi:hypothetical protein